MDRRRATAGCAVVVSLLVTTALRPNQAQGTGVRMIPVEAEADRYWSRWRGPSGQGVVEGTGYTDRWSATEHVLWRTPVPGRGNSSPIVWGGGGSS